MTHQVRSFYKAVGCFVNKLTIQVRMYWTGGQTSIQVDRVVKALDRMECYLGKDRSICFVVFIFTQRNYATWRTRCRLNSFRN